MIKIYTPYGDTYTINDKNEFEVAGKPSGEWLFLGISHVKRSEFIPVKDLPIRLAEIELCYKNGNPQWTVRDRDHGTVREWGNTSVHGIKSISIK